MSVNKKGMSLVIVIFAMLMFALLGWSLSSMISTDFDASSRLLESERALNLAESGGQWALVRYMNDATWRTDLNNDRDCNDTGERPKYFLSPGEYTVCCRNPQTGEAGDAIIEVRGYVPTETSYLAMRQLKLSVSAGTINEASAIKHLFDWSDWHNNSSIDGDIVVVDRPADTTDGYEGNNNSTHNETADLNVPDVSSGLRDRVPTDTGYQGIDMQYFRDQAGSRVWAPTALQLDAVIDSVSVVSARQLQVRLKSDVFTTPPPGPSGSSWTQEVVLRNKREDLILANKWGYRNWGVIVNRISNNTVTLEFDASINFNSRPADRWLANEDVALTRRFYYDSNHSNPNHDYDNENLWYVTGDLLLDVRDDNLTFNGTSLVAERDIVIKGEDAISMVASRQRVPRGRRSRRVIRLTYPNLATQYGNILSYETPSDNNETQRRDARNFDGLIYTQNGTIYLNYIDGRSVMGNDVYLDGRVRIRYSTRFVKDNGFIGAFDSITWQEQ
ncbi:MAG: hypothetical protein WDL87_07195 [Candidatus Omnitrophota bacterium]|jgi:hypothetical protein